MRPYGASLFILLHFFLVAHQTYAQRHIVKNYGEENQKLYEIEKPLDVPCSVPMCEGPLSSIYCHGPILSTAWQFGMQKTCPGDKMKFAAETVLSNFEALQYPITRTKFEIFCRDNFEASEYLKMAHLTDWTAEPQFLKNITNLEMRQLASEIHRKWKLLAREFQNDVFRNPELYPLLPVKNPFIVPGGRFDVYFYWDTYWIIKGLLVSNMIKTAEGIINNFADLIKTNGFIPNSGNIQLSRRSQPPLFAQMIWDYSQYTGKYEKDWLLAMAQEVEFWENNRTVSVLNHTMFTYKTITNCPRPENFIDDYQLGINQSDPSKVWKSISSACESGWDFSSRWMRQDEKHLGSLHADEIIPVDLNMYMALNYYVLEQYNNYFSEFSTSDYYHKKYVKLLKAIEDVLWDENEGVWFDYDMQETKKNRNFYPSNIFPLLINEFGKRADRVAQYLKISGALNFKGGIPTTLSFNGSQQWDFPNVWAPNQHFLIKSFLATNNTYLNEQAKVQAYKFIQVVFNGLFNPEKGTQGAVWEKYDAREISGIPGGGGEYLVQEGFGWTNGATLDLIWMFRESEMHDKNQLFGSLWQKVFIISAWSFSSMLVLWFAIRGCCCKIFDIGQHSESVSLLVDDDDDSDSV